MSHSSVEVAIDHSASLPWWLTLRDLAIATAVVVAMALIGGFLLLTSAHAQTRGELRIGYQKSASLFVLQRRGGGLATVNPRPGPCTTPTIQYIHHPWTSLATSCVSRRRPGA